MLIVLFTLFMTLFGGNVDIFYVDKIEQGIKKEIIDKERKNDTLQQLDRLLLCAEGKRHRKRVEAHYEANTKNYKVTAF